MTNSVNELSYALCMEAGRTEARPYKIKEYIAHGADINYQLEEDGFTPLMLAVDRDDEPLVTYFLQQGANPLIKNKYQEIASNIALVHSPIYQLLKNYELLMATATNDITCAKAALKAGANINFQGIDGYTALLIAAELGLLEFVELYLVNGADSSLSRNDGGGIYELATGELVYETIDNGKPFTDEEKNSLLHRENEDYGRWDRWRSKAIEARNGQPFNISQLNISNFNPPPTESQLVELEQHFGHPLPPLLKEIFNHYNGGRPELDHCGVDGRWTIGDFFSLDENRTSAGNIWWVINNFSEHFGPETLPIAYSYHNDIYFLKWVDGIAQVWIFGYNDAEFDFDDEENDGTPSVCIYESLDEFMEALYESND